VFPPPPQLEVIATAETSSAKHAVSQKPLAAHFLLKSSRGNRRNGRNTRAVAAPGKVSVKTTMIWKVPAGVVDDVLIVTAPVPAE
jgi:hypothetical protein